MLGRPLVLISLLFLLPGEVIAKPSLEPFPSRESLRELQLKAYGCSRENSSRLCTATRDLANPLMDHPRLSAACKDTVWELLQVATVVSSNNYKRRDSIDSPARRLTVVCGAKEPAQPASPMPGATNPNQT